MSDVVVVGGGVAGLAAATALAEAGRRVLVLEARGQLGGRATAFADRETGEYVDNGQHVLFGCYRETFALLRRIGAESNVRVQPSLEVPYLDAAGRRSVLRCPPLPPPLHLLGGVLRWNALPWSERLAVLRVAPAVVGRVFRLRGTLRRTAGALAEAVRPAARVGQGFSPDNERANQTVAEWLTQHGQRGRLREWLWEPLAVAALNQPVEEAAAAPFVTVLRRMFGPDRRDASIALPAVPLHEMYASPARRYIEAHGGEVRLNALARVRIEAGRVAGVEVRGEPIPARRVIAAVPWFALPALVAGDPGPLAPVMASAGALESKPIVTVNLWYDRTVIHEPFIGLPGRSIQWVFDKRQAFGERASHLSLVASAAAELVPLGNDDLIALAAREIAAALPRAAEATLVRGTVIREKRATFSLAPGQPLRPPVTTPIEGLWLAGDWIDTGLPGTIESAAEAGHEAARSVTMSVTNTAPSTKHPAPTP